MCHDVDTGFGGAQSVNEPAPGGGGAGEDDEPTMRAAQWRDQPGRLLGRLLPVAGLLECLPQVLVGGQRRAPAQQGCLPPVETSLLLTRYDPARVTKGEMLAVEDVQEILSVKLLGVIPESESVLRASNTGTPVAFDEDSPAGRAYLDAVARFLGEQREMRFVQPERRGFFRLLFGRA